MWGKRQKRREDRRIYKEKKIECLCDCLSHDTCNVVCLFQCKVCDVRYIKGCPATGTCGRLTIHYNTLEPRNLPQAIYSRLASSEFLLRGGRGRGGEGRGGSINFKIYQLHREEAGGQTGGA